MTGFDEPAKQLAQSPRDVRLLLVKYQQCPLLADCVEKVGVEADRDR
jgi:hypothetical protein